MEVSNELKDLISGKNLNENEAWCADCNGDGEVHFSCCGDDVKDTLTEDYDLCPTCHEHLSGREKCETCNGTGKIEIKK